MRASEVKPDGRMFALFVSRSAGGKSCAAMSVLDEEDTGEVLDFDIRKGYIGQPYLKLDKWNITQFAPISTGYADVEKHMKQAMALFGVRGQKPFGTLIIDSLWSLLRILLTDSVSLNTKGAVKGQMKLTGPADYNYQSQTLFEFFDYIRSLPCHVIINCLLVDKFVPGNKRDRDGNLMEYQEQVKDGVELAGLTNKLAAIVPGYFDEVYQFGRDSTGSKFHVEFYSDLARSVHKMPRGPVDITGKSFYEVWKGLVKK